MSVLHYPKSFKVTASVNNIPVAFSTAAGSYLGADIARRKCKHMMIFNETAVQISLITAPSLTVPPATDTNRVFIPANSFIVFDDFPVYDNLYIQSEGSAISAGTVEVQIW